MQHIQTKSQKGEGEKKRYFLGLGSNLGDRLSNLNRAIDLLSFLDNKAVSSIYITKALLPLKGNPLWDKEFFNLVISGESRLNPEDVFKFCKDVESKLGRDFSQPKWSPRLIDIDILLAGEAVIKSNEYTVPHEHMLKRAFVLVPLCELASNLIHPISKRTILEHLQELTLKDINDVRKFR
jgi:2-amino-4-hydroxy-6-hydroxymethyldihydropteridine diphosphokinase